MNMIKKVFLNPTYDELEDTRPDLEEDSELWEILFKIGRLTNKKIVPLLHYVRAGGGRIKIEVDQYVIRFEENENSIEKGEYESFKLNVLSQYKGLIQKCLIELTNKIKNLEGSEKHLVSELNFSN